nr:MAG TPA: hypothetical protein [Caudoviricetes sp.]
MLGGFRKSASLNRTYQWLIKKAVNFDRFLSFNH